MTQTQISEIMMALHSAGLLTNPVATRSVLTDAFKDEIHLVWTVDDVQTIALDISDEDAREVLELAFQDHDAGIGVNWDVLVARVQDWKQTRGPE